MARHGSILLLADDYPGHANTIHDQLRAIRELSRHRVRLFNPRGVRTPPTLGLGDFDAIIIHWSLVIISESYLAASVIEELRQYPGPKILMIQDDYRWVDRMTAAMRHLKIDVLFTLVPSGEIPKIWSEGVLPGVRKITYLAGYVPEHLIARSVPPIADRRLDLVYRGRELPFWLGRLGQEKAQIARGVSERAAPFSLKIDIAFREGERIYGEEWIDFICSGRATLGTESGSSITDFDGTIEKSVLAYRALHPDAPFEEVHQAVLTSVEGNVRMNVISPRIFEAAALRTPMVLFPGDYSGILIPHRHYIPLKKDFSNFAEIAEQLRDPSGLQVMAERAYQEIALSSRYSLRAFVDEVDDAIEAVAAFVPAGRYPYRLQVARVQNALRPSTYVASGLLPHIPRHAFRLLLALRTLLENPSLALPLLGSMLTGRVGPSSWPNLGADLIRFHLIREAARGREVPGTPFYLALNLGAEGRAVLTSQPGPARPMALETPDALDKVSLSWNHSMVGTHLPCSWRFPRHSIRVGEDGIHHFETLSLLGPEPGQIIARAAVLGQNGAFSVREVSSQFRVYAPLVLAAMRDTLRSREGRGLLTTWLGDRNLRDAIGLNHLMGDILKLRSLGEAIRKSPGFSIERVTKGSEVTFRSVAGSATGADGTDLSPSTSRIVWDHRAVGRRLSLAPLTGDQLELVMGEDGVHTFPALHFIGLRYPGRLSRLFREFVN